jgi:hypothetical protein
MTVGGEHLTVSYKERAQREAYLLNRAIYRDYRWRFLPFVSHATREFEYVPATHDVRSTTDRFGNIVNRFDDTPLLVSPLLLPSEPRRIGESQAVTGWQVDVDAPPPIGDRLLMGWDAPNRIGLSEVLQTTTSTPDQADPALTVMPSLTYPLDAGPQMDQEKPENPDDELYALHFQVFTDIRAMIADRPAEPS